MPPYAVWYAGRDDIATFLPAGPLKEHWRLRPVRANGQLAFGCYAWDEHRGLHVAHSIDVVALRGGQIAGITSFLDLDANVFERFGLPAHLPANDAVTGARPR
jgi:RNA polymerase sigma-70 factor (ECF subfamily)